MRKLSLKSFVFLSLYLIFTTFAYASPINSLFHNPGDPIAGNPKGDVTVVEFFDYQCSHCIAMAPVISALLRHNPNVRVVFKEFPIRGAVSAFEARAALASKQQGKYYQFNHALLTANHVLSEQTILEIAKDQRLNVNQLKKEMNSPAITNQIKANYRLAEKLNVDGTPAFFIGKTNSTKENQVQFILGAMTLAELQKAVNNAR